MGKSINSNTRAQKSGIFQRLKGLVYEEGLARDSLSNSVKSFGSKNTETYERFMNMQKNTNTMGYETSLAYREAILKNAKEDISIGKVSLGSDNSKIVNEAIADKTILDTFGYGSSKPAEKVYNNELSKAKGAIAFNTSKNMFTGYYSSPLKNGLDARKNMNFLENEELQKAVTRIGGTAAIGGAVASSLISNNVEDEKTKENNKRLLTKYKAY